MAADLRRDPVRVSVYPTTESDVGHDFVTVLNQGTPLFDRNRRLKALVDKLPFEELFDTYSKQCAKDSKRGNFQVNFGLASGLSCEKHNPQSDLAHYGVSIPSQLVGTKERLDLLVLLSEVCKLIGVNWDNPDSHRAQSYIRLLHKIMGDERINVALVTFHWVPLNADGFPPNEFGCVEPHVDKQNPDGPPELEPVVMINKIIQGSDGKLYWSGFIVNQKKSLVDANDRRLISRRVAHSLGKYWLSVPRFRLPTTTAPDWCHYGCGDRGVFVSCRGDRLTSVVLASRASMDKGTYFLSALVWALKVFRGMVGDDFYLIDAISICTSLLLFCNPEPLVHALISGSLKGVWHTRSRVPGGAMGLLVQIAVERNGGINQGKGGTRRCQPFCNTRTVDVEKYICFMRHVHRDCRRSQQKPKPCTVDSYKATVMEYQRVYSQSRTITLSMQHVVHVLSMSGCLLSNGCLSQFAIISGTNSNADQLKKLFGTKVLPPDKMAVIQTQTARYFTSVLENPVFVSVIENSGCELTRDGKIDSRRPSGEDGKKKLTITSAANDLFYPSQDFLSVVEHGQMYQRWLPEFDGSRFTAQPVEQLDPSRPNWIYPDDPSQTLMEGTLILKATEETNREQQDDSNREQQYLLERSVMENHHFAQVKKLFFGRPEQGQSFDDYYSAVLAQAAPILAKYIEMERSGISSPSRKLNPSEMHMRVWNNQKDDRLVAAMRAIEEEIDLETEPATELERPGAFDEPPGPAARQRTVKPPAARQRTFKPPAARGKRLLLQPPTEKPRGKHLLLEPPTEMPPLHIPDQDENEDEHETFNDSLLTAPLMEDTIFDDDTVCEVEKASGCANMQWKGKGKRKVVPDADPFTADPQSKSRRVSIHPQVRVRKIPADTNHRLARGKRTAANEQQELETQPPPPVQPVEQEPVSHRTRSLLPLLREGQDHGADRIVDWSDENMDAVAAVETVAGCIRRVYGRPGSSNRDMWDDSFRDLHGSRDLFQSNIPLYNNQGLYDEAKNAWNSSRIRAGQSRGPGFLARSFEFEETYVHERLLFSCIYSLIPEMNDFNVVGRCSLCDEVAVMLLGEGSERDENLLQWWFPSRQLAHRFYMMCIILTLGSSRYYTDLHHRCRRKFEQQVQAAKAFEPKGSTKALKLSELLQHKYFVIGFGSLGDEIPPFYIIGNQMLPIDSHHRHLLTYRYDFCIAIGHLGYHRKHTLRKQTKASVPGKALYIRPLRPTED